LCLRRKETGARAGGGERDAAPQDEQRDVLGEQASGGFRRGNCARRGRRFAGRRRRSGAAPCKGACEGVAKAHPGHSIRGGTRCVTCARRQLIPAAAVFHSSCPGRSALKTRVDALMTRASIEKKRFGRKGWIAGSSPAMTDGSVAKAIGLTRSLCWRGREPS